MLRFLWFRSRRPRRAQLWPPPLTMRPVRRPDAPAYVLGEYESDITRGRREPQRAHVSAPEQRQMG
jgi:hypothetical protein